MDISREDREFLIRELTTELKAKPDGGNKNLIVPKCPYCGKEGGKFGIYIGKEVGRKKLFSSNCFSCQRSNQDINQLLIDIGRQDLLITKKASFEPVEVPEFLSIENEDEIDDSLLTIEMPDGWKRCYNNRYLNSRGFEEDDYDYFSVGTTKGENFKFDDYVVFPVIDNGKIVGFVSRHTWSKEKIDNYNAKAKKEGKYQIRRYNNSLESDGNPFHKMLYNYDAVIEDETDTVIIVEGIFDVIALTRKLNLYDNSRIAVVATFGKNISKEHIWKLQSKGVKTVVLGYDGDAVKAINKNAEMLSEFFDVFVAHIEDPNADFDSMDFWEIYDVFDKSLLTPREYKLKVVQLWKN